MQRRSPDADELLASESPLCWSIGTHKPRALQDSAGSNVAEVICIFVHFATEHIHVVFTTSAQEFSAVLAKFEPAM